MDKQIKASPEPTGVTINVVPHEGVKYRDFMKQARDFLNTQSYLEIGSRNGGSLKDVSCDVVAIDPNFVISTDVIMDKKQAHFFQMTSDEFFKRFNLLNFFPDKVDMAFLDGLHLFEFLLRDFINVEKYCHKSSVIFMHDCLPINYEMAQRVSLKERNDLDHAVWWTGDVWKILPTLRKYRPDLKLLALDCPPTGLLAVTNFDPMSTALEDNYFDILDEFMECDLTDNNIAEFWQSTNTQDSSELMSLENFFKHFY